MNVRTWTDKDGRDWTVWLERAGQPVLAFGSDGEVATIEVGFRDGLEDVSGARLQRLLDKARG